MSARTAAFALLFTAAGLAGCAAETTKGGDHLETPDDPPRADSVDDPETPTPSSSGEAIEPTEPASDPERTEPAKPPVIPAGACDLMKPFGELEALPTNTSGYETGGRFSTDELTLYFSRKTGTAAMQPMMLKRKAKDQPWGTASALTTIDSATADDSYFITTTDELTAFFVSSRLGDLDVFRTTRTSKTAAWATPSFVSQVGTSSIEDDVWVTQKGTAIYFDSNRSGNRELYRAAIDESGSVSAPVLVAGGPTSTADETNPVVSGDELTMYFTRTTSGQQEIRVSKRGSLTEQWGTSTLVPELNSTAADRVTWMSADGCRVIVSSTRSGGAGSSDLYLATKPE